MINVYMPIPPGRPIAKAVLTALSKQTIDLQLLPMGTVPSKDKSFNDRLDSIVASRNLIRQFAMDDDMFIMLDSDTIILQETGLALLVGELNQEPELGAVALVKYTNMIGTAHVGLACMAIRGEVIKQIPFRHDSCRCDCDAFGNDVRKSKWHIRYTHQMIEGIKDA